MQVFPHIPLYIGVSGFVMYWLVVLSSSTYRNELKYGSRINAICGVLISLVPFLSFVWALCLIVIRVDTDGIVAWFKAPVCRKDTPSD